MTGRKTRILVLLVSLAALALPGCGSKNDAAPSLNLAANHPAGWYTTHRNAYANQQSQCKECHGADLLGGIALVGCFSATYGAFTCHAGGHGPRPVPHPIPYTPAALHGPAAKANLVYCQGCHGQPGGPGSNPRFNVAIGILVNGCEDCHAVNTAHPPLPNATNGWLGHASAGNIANACSLCHGVDLSGGVGPACSSCHFNLAPGQIPVAGTCVSCHGKPPADPAHPAHNAVASLTGQCTPCHYGAGSGTPLHGNGTVNVSFAPAYNARSGNAILNPDQSCSNVSCHGGVTAPPWPTGIINVASECTRCHLAGTAFQTPQYNSYYSGEHTKHLQDVGLICADCHDMTVVTSGASHFSNMATPAFELAPRLTIKVPAYQTSGSCNPGSTPPPGTYSIGVCHGPETW